jgi:hypothetical protein
MVVAGDRRELVRILLGDGRAEPERDASPEAFVSRAAPGVPVTFVTPTSTDGGADEGDLTDNLDRLSRLHRAGDLSDTEYADAKQKVLDGA